jgi:hypothetical protein
VACSILVIIWHLLSGPAARYAGLGAGYYQARAGTGRELGNRTRQIQDPGFGVTVTRTR